MFLYQHADRSQGGARVRPRADRAPRGAARRGGDRARPGDHERRPLPTGLRRGPGHGGAVDRRDRGTDPPPARNQRTCPSSSMRTSSIRAGTTSPIAASRAPTARWSAPPASATRSTMCPTSKASGASGSGSGTRASTPHTPTPRGKRTPRHPFPIPPVADAQARLVDRPVWRLGLRGMRALYHLVSGGNRLDRGSGGDPRGDRCMTPLVPPYRRPALPVSGRRALDRARSTGSADLPRRVRRPGAAVALPRRAGPVQHALSPGDWRGADLGLGRHRRGVGDRPHDPVRRPGHPRHGGAAAGLDDRNPRPLRQ